MTKGGSHGASPCCATTRSGQLANLSKGFTKFPSSKPLLQNLVHVYGDRLNRPDEALAYADKLVELSPRDSVRVGGPGRVVARKGDVEAALRDGERAAASQPIVR